MKCNENCHGRFFVLIEMASGAGHVYTYFPGCQDLEKRKDLRWNVTEFFETKRVRGDAYEMTMQVMTMQCPGDCRGSADVVFAHEL